MTQVNGTIYSFQFHVTTKTGENEKPEQTLHTAECRFCPPSLRFHPTAAPQDSVSFCTVLSERVCELASDFCEKISNFASGLFQCPETTQQKQNSHHLYLLVGADAAFFD